MTAPGKTLSEKFRTARTTEIIGDLIGISDRTVEKALYIVDHGDEELKKKLRRTPKPSIDNAYRQVRELVEPRPTPVLPVDVP